MTPEGEDLRRHLSRREFLVVVGVGVPAALTFGRREPTGRPPDRPAGWIGHFEHLGPETRRLGRLYLERTDPAPTEGELAELVERRVPELGEARLSSARAREIVTESIRGDFARGDTIRLEGWLLSLTEVRIAALASYRHAG